MLTIKCQEVETTANDLREWEGQEVVSFDWFRV